MKHILTVTTIAMLALGAASCNKQETNPAGIPHPGNTARATGHYYANGFRVDYFVGSPWRQHVIDGPSSTHYYGPYKCDDGFGACAYKVTATWAMTGAPTGTDDGNTFDSINLDEQGGYSQAVLWADASNYYLLHKRTNTTSGMDLYSGSGVVNRPETPIVFPEDSSISTISAGSYRVVNTNTAACSYAVLIIPADSIREAKGATIE